MSQVAGGEATPSSVVCCDLDGVIWRGEDPIPGAAGGVAKLRDAGLRVVFVTNNSGARVADTVGRLAAMGIAAEPGDLATSAQAAASVLARDLPDGARVLPCAGAGVIEALHASGFTVVDDGPADAVVVLGLWFLTQFLTQTSSGIATAAHIGGFIFGALVAFSLKGAGFPRQRVTQPLYPGPPAY